MPRQVVPSTDKICQEEFPNHCIKALYKRRSKSVKKQGVSNLVQSIPKAYLEPSHTSKMDFL